MNADSQAHKPAVKERFREEMRKFAMISAYLWVCFAVILLYAASVQEEQGPTALHYGVALVKALVIGKFLLIGDAIKVGARASGPTLVHRIAWKSFAFLLLLIVFTILEEIVVGWFHDQTIRQSLGEFFGRPWLQLLAPELVMLLILIPLISATELRKAMGAEQFRAHFLGRSDD